MNRRYVYVDELLGFPGNDRLRDEIRRLIDNDKVKTYEERTAEDK